MKTDRPSPPEHRGSQKKHGSLHLVLPLLVVIASCLAPAPAIVADAPFDTAAFATRARALAEAYRAGDAARMWQDFDETMRSAMGDLERFEQVLRGLESQTGALETCVSEHWERQAGYIQYTAQCRYARSLVPLVLLFAFDPSGKLAGFWVKPEATPYPTAFLDYEPRTLLRLPFHGEWTVVWGGRTLQENYHAVARDQRFAYDFLVVKDSLSRKSPGTRNEDYHCFGLPIVAPAAGQVVWRQDGIPDNEPGQMNAEQPFGNAVILDHGNGEFSVLAHFQRGSVQVKRGQQVAAADTLGRCGNSGNSSEPHLHYHLQNGPDLIAADGLPAVFVDYRVGDLTVERGEPTRGARIRPK